MLVFYFLLWPEPCLDRKKRLLLLQEAQESIKSYIASAIGHQTYKMALIMLVYKIKRCINLLGLPNLIKKLKKWQPNYAGIVRFILETTYFKPIHRIIIKQLKLSSQKIASSN